MSKTLVNTISMTLLTLAALAPTVVLVKAGVTDSHWWLVPAGATMIVPYTILDWLRHQ